MPQRPEHGLSIDQFVSVFPRALVKDVVLVENIPEIIPDSECKIQPSQAPAEVVSHFSKDAQSGQFVHGENVWTYEPAQKLRRPRLPVYDAYYNRAFNLSPEVRRVLGETAPLGKYLKELKSMKSTEVSTDNLLPKWERAERFPDGLKIPGEERQLVLLFAEDSADYNRFVHRLVLGEYEGSPPSIGHIFTAGRLTLDGRVKY